MTVLQRVCCIAIRLANRQLVVAHTAHCISQELVTATSRSACCAYKLANTKLCSECVLLLDRLITRYCGKIMIVIY